MNSFQIKIRSLSKSKPQWSNYSLLYSRKQSNKCGALRETASAPKEEKRRRRRRWLCDQGEFDLAISQREYTTILLFGHTQGCFWSDYYIKMALNCNLITSKYVWPNNNIGRNGFTSNAIMNNALLQRIVMRFKTCYTMLHIDQKFCRLCLI